MALISAKVRLFNGHSYKNTNLTRTVPSLAFSTTHQRIHAEDRQALLSHAYNKRICSGRFLYKCRSFRRIGMAGTSVRRMQRCGMEVTKGESFPAIDEVDVEGR